MPALVVLLLAALTLVRIVAQTTLLRVLTALVMLLLAALVLVKGITLATLLRVLPALVMLILTPLVVLALAALVTVLLVGNKFLRSGSVIIALPACLVYGWSVHIQLVIGKLLPGAVAANYSNRLYLAIGVVFHLVYFRAAVVSSAVIVSGAGVFIIDNSGIVNNGYVIPHHVIIYVYNVDVSCGHIIPIGAAGLPAAAVVSLRRKRRPPVVVA